MISWLSVLFSPQPYESLCRTSTIFPDVLCSPSARALHIMFTETFQIKYPFKMNFQRHLLSTYYVLPVLHRWFYLSSPKPLIRDMPLSPFYRQGCRSRRATTSRMVLMVTGLNLNLPLQSFWYCPSTISLPPLTWVRLSAEAKQFTFWSYVYSNYPCFRKGCNAINQGKYGPALPVRVT